MMYRPIGLTWYLKTSSDSRTCFMEGLTILVACQKCGWRRTRVVQAQVFSVQWIRQVFILRQSIMVVFLYRAKILTSTVNSFEPLTITMQRQKTSSTQSAHSLYDKEHKGVLRHFIITVLKIMYKISLMGVSSDKKFR